MKDYIWVVEARIFGHWEAMASFGTRADARRWLGSRDGFSAGRIRKYQRVGK